jgi:hypothetical protein
MPSTSGSVLRPAAGGRTTSTSCGFYALDVGLGVATTSSSQASRRPSPFLCPRCRAQYCDWPLRVDGEFYICPFLCPRYRADSATSGYRTERQVRCSGVSMPSVSGGVLRCRRPGEKGTRHEFLCPRYRAGVATDVKIHELNDTPATFLCPRCRAGYCDRRRNRPFDTEPSSVSMPSVSSGLLRPMRDIVACEQGDAAACAILTSGVHVGNHHPPLQPGGSGTDLCGCACAKLALPSGRKAVLAQPEAVGVLGPARGCHTPSCAIDRRRHPGGQDGSSGFGADPGRLVAASSRPRPR